MIWFYNVINWMFRTPVGRIISAFTAIATVVLVIFGFGYTKGGERERLKGARRSSRALRKRLEIENEVEDLGSDDLVDRASHWVR